MPTYPIQCSRTYINPAGNVSASGCYRSHTTQRMANMFPIWMHLRENPRSIGQQFLSPIAMELQSLEEKMNELFQNKFLPTARVDEIDILYSTEIPSDIDITDPSASGITCIAAPSGLPPSGDIKFWIDEVDTLQEFYYDKLPTRIEVLGEFDADVSHSTIDSIIWHTTPSGILDKNNKYVDMWDRQHDITWAYSENHFFKHDRETLEAYASYDLNGTGTPIDLFYYRGLLWWIGSSFGEYFLNISNPKTQVPERTTLDILATFNISNGVVENPYGIHIDNEGNIWIKDNPHTITYQLKPRYDYFILDKTSKNIYFREDYRGSGVFITNQTA